VALLGGGCSLPLGAFAEATDGTVRMRAVVLRPDGSDAIRAEAEGATAEAAAQLVSEEIRRAGGDRILDDLVR
jgi:hydroxymethylbilane synthase